MTNIPARIVSVVLHPLVLAIVATFLISIHTIGINQAYLWTGAVILIALLILLFEYYGVRKGFFSNFDVSNRRQRWPLFIFSLVLLSGFMISVMAFGGPIQLLIGCIYVAFGILVFSLVNRKIKASVHVGATAAFFVSMGILYGGYFYLGLLGIPLVAWSRLKLHRHTKSEVIVGGGLGAFITVILYVVIQYFQFL